MFTEARNQFSFLKDDSIRAAEEAASRCKIKIFSWWQAILDFFIHLIPPLRKRRNRNERAMFEVIQKYAGDIVIALSTYESKFYENEDYNARTGCFSGAISREENKAENTFTELVRKATQELRALGMGNFFYQPVQERLMECGYPGHINVKPGVYYWTALPKFFAKRLRK